MSDNTHNSFQVTLSALDIISINHTTCRVAVHILHLILYAASCFKSVACRFFVIILSVNSFKVKLHRMFFSETLQTSRGKVNNPAAFETRVRIPQIAFVLTLCVCVCLRQCFMSLLDTQGEKRDIFSLSAVVCSANSCFSIVFSHKGESEASPAGGSDPERLR